MIRKSRKPVQVFDPHLTACAAPLEAPPLIEPPTLAATAHARSEPEAVLVTAAAVEGPAPDIFLVSGWGRGRGGEEARKRSERERERRGKGGACWWCFGEVFLVRGG